MPCGIYKRTKSNSRSRYYGITKKEVVEKTVKRKCLKCSKGFKSTGKHNRLCADCNRENGNLHWGELVSMGNGRRRSSRMY